MLFRSPYLILDARYEKVREDGVIRSRAVMIGIGINWEGRRCVLGVELANRESSSSWTSGSGWLTVISGSGRETVTSGDSCSTTTSPVPTDMLAAWLVPAFPA